MTPNQFTEWRVKMGLSKSAAADAIGVSRNMPQKYESGGALIPTYVALACAAYEKQIPPYGDKND